MIIVITRFLLLVRISCFCIDKSIVNFQFYITSGNNDWIVSSQYPSGVYASVVTGPGVAIPPEASWIWETPVIEGRTLTITRYFFIVGIPKSVLLESRIDNYGLAKLNGGTACSIPDYLNLYTCDFTFSSISGLNKLEYIATDFGGISAVMYKLTIISKLV